MDETIIERLRAEGLLPLLHYDDEFYTNKSQPMDLVIQRVLGGRTEVEIEDISDIVHLLYIRDPSRVTSIAEDLLALREGLIAPIVAYHELEDLEGVGYNSEYEEGGALYEEDEEDAELDQDEALTGHAEDEELGYEEVWDEEAWPKKMSVRMLNEVEEENYPPEEGRVAEDEHLVDELDAMGWGEHEGEAALYLRRAMKHGLPSVDEIVASIVRTGRDEQYGYNHNAIAEYVPLIDAFLNAYFEESGVGTVDTGLSELSIS